MIENKTFEELDREVKSMYAVKLTKGHLAAFDSVISVFMANCVEELLTLSPDDAFNLSMTLGFIADFDLHRRIALDGDLSKDKLEMFLNLKEDLLKTGISTVEIKKL